MPAASTKRLPVSQALSFVAVASVVPDVRRWAAIVIGGLGRPGKTDDARLIVSELVANAIHAAPEELIEVVITFDGVESVIAVWDPAPGFPQMNTDPLADLDNGDVDVNQGRGLLLVMEMATDWGCAPALGRGGKWVWARM